MAPQCSATGKSEELPFFVYGTLRVGESNYRRYVAGKTTQEYPAILPAHTLYARDLPCVTDASDGSQVVGDLLFVPTELYAHVLAALDELEEYYPEEADPWYIRVKRRVHYTDAEGVAREVDAWVYHGGKRTLRQYSADDRVPSGDWIAFYRAAGRDGDYRAASRTDREEPR
jgi:gamma-glutamylcyclotransferase (GGCT)/AIG2-like uncharacterized protein YtfP